MHKRINTIVLGIMIFALTAAFFVVPKKDFSERENRMLEKLPDISVKSVTDGSLAEGLKNYSTDHFPARDRWIEINTDYNLALGRKEINGIYFCGKGYLIEKYSRAEYDRTALAVNRFCERVQANVSFMAVPTSVVINSELLPFGADTDDQLKDRNTFYSLLNCDGICAEDELRKDNKSVQCFYKYDHHWTVYGAYSGFKSYMKYISEKNSENFTEKSLIFGAVDSDFRGTLFNKVGKTGLGCDEITEPDISGLDITYTTPEGEYSSLFFAKALEGNNKYDYYLGGNKPLVTIKNNDIKDGKKLLIIKDSYANSIAPFFAAYYGEVTLIDPRYYLSPISDYVNENEISEVLFIYNMNMLASDSAIRGVK